MKELTKKALYMIKEGNINVDNLDEKSIEEYNSMAEEFVVDVDKAYKKALKDMRMCERMKEDIEVKHIKADEILTEFLTTLGYTELVDKFNKLDKWYS